MPADLFPLCAQLCRDGGESLGDIHQQILHGGDLRLLAANAHLRAAGAACGLLTLIAEHFVFHDFFLRILNMLHRILVNLSSFY